MTKSYFGIFAKQVIEKDRAGDEDDDLLRATAYIKKLHEFEQFTSDRAGDPHTANYYRERGLITLDWLTVLIPFSSRSVIVNVLMQAGTYFQQAACSPQEDLRVAKADQKLALHAYMEAIAISGRSAPDLEIYTHINCLKFIAAFKYQDEDLKELVGAIQTRALLLADLFPVYVKLQANIDFLKNQDQTLWLIRRLLYKLVEAIGANSTYKIDHDCVAVLYQAYEACVKNWFEEIYNPELENRFRLELMELLLKRNGWKFSDLDPHLITSSAIEHDDHGWMQLTKKPLRIAEYGAQDHFCSLEGFEINHKTGSIKFTFSNYPHGFDRIDDNPLTLYDLTEMLESNVSVAHFSLDPIDPQKMYHPFNTMRFAPKNIYRTQFLNTMLLSDYILKFLTTGQEVQGQYPYDMPKIETAIAKLPEHLKKIIYDFHQAKQYNAGSIHRFWIEAEQATEASLDDDSGICKVAVADLRIVVKKHTMERDHNGNLVDTQKDHEGWDFYILTLQQKSEITAGTRIINGPAMVFVNDDQLCFISKSTNKIYKRICLSANYIAQLKQLTGYDLQKLQILKKHLRDPDDKIIVTIDNAMLLYKLIVGITTLNKEPTYLSPEYVFAQEFTKHYDEFSEYILEFARLRELSKITVAIRLLNGHKAGTEQKAINLQKLLDSLPSWEQKDSHISNYSSYFNLPDPGLLLTEEEMNFAIFRHKNIEFIKKILPKTIYKNRLANLIEICQPITADSDEVNRACNDLYNQNATEITRKHGSNAWSTNSTRIWNEICAKKSEYAQQLTNSKKSQLQAAFKKQFPDLSSEYLERLLNNAMRGQVGGFADELAQRDFIETKKQIQEMIADSKKLLKGFQTIGLAKREREEHDVEAELDQECLWVPASVGHHVEGNSCHFVYGGVRVMPRINSITSTNQNFSRMMGNAFSGTSGRTTVTSTQISRSSTVGHQPGSRNFQTTFVNAGATARAQASANLSANANISRGIFSSYQSTARASTNSYQQASSSYTSRTQVSSSFNPGYRAATASYQSSASAPPRQQPASSNFTSARGSTGSYQQANSSHGGGGGGSSNRGASNNSDFIDGLKLRTELSFKEAGLLDQSGKLTTKALQCIKDSDNRIKDGDKLNNKQVIDRLTKNGEPIENWAKYKTSSVTLGTGNKAQIHFYYNNRTGEVVQDIDFKVKGGFGLKGDDVSPFSRNPEKEPISQKDACHTLSL